MSDFSHLPVSEALFEALELIALGYTFEYGRPVQVGDLLLRDKTLAEIQAGAATLKYPQVREFQSRIFLPGQPLYRAPTKCFHTMGTEIRRIYPTRGKYNLPENQTVTVKDQDGKEQTVLAPEHDPVCFVSVLPTSTSSTLGIGQNTLEQINGGLGLTFIFPKAYTDAPAAQEAAQRVFDRFKRQDLRAITIPLPDTDEAREQENEIYMTGGGGCSPVGNTPAFQSSYQVTANVRFYYYGNNSPF